MEKLSKLISFISYPLFTTFYSMVMFVAMSNAVQRGYGAYCIDILIRSIIVTIIIPLALFGIMKQIGMISDLNMNNKKERLLPYITTIICMAVFLIMMYNNNSPIYILFIIFGSIISLLAVTIINFFWKISAHTTGMGGLSAAILVMTICNGNGITPLCVAIFMSGLVGSARVFLGEHSLSQAVSGFLLGFINVFICGIFGALII